MKAFIVLAALVACAMAKPGLVYSNVAGHPWTQTYGHALTYAAAPAVTYASAPAVTYASAPAVTYASAPAVTYAAAPAVTYSAIATPVATKTQYHAQDELGQASYGYAHPGQAAAAVRDAAGNVKGSYAYVDPTGKQVRVDYVADHNGYRAESNALPQGPVAHLVAPAPVQETPEVAAARAAHLSAHNEVKSRQRRGAVYAASPLTWASHPYGTHHAYTYNTAYTSPITTYAASPVTTYAASPVTTYAASPVTTYAASPITTYAAAPLAHTYTSAVVSPVVREATLTKIHNNPGHAVSYRVD